MGNIKKLVEGNKTMDNTNTVSTINKIYGFIKDIEFIDDEMDILKDVKKIDYELKNFYYWNAMNKYKSLSDKYYSKLDEMGYFKFKDNTNRSPAEKLKHNLRVIKAWIIRIFALNAVDEVAETVLKDQLKEIITKYGSNEIVENAELVYNIFDAFDNNLYDKLKNKIQG